MSTTIVTVHDPLAETVREHWDRHAAALESGDVRRILEAHRDGLIATRELERDCMSMSDPESSARDGYAASIAALDALIEDADADIAKLEARP